MQFFRTHFVVTKDVLTLYMGASTALAWSSDHHFTIKIQNMSGGDTDNHMYLLISVASAWSHFSVLCYSL